MTILIVDDEKNIRAGIRKILGETLGPSIRFLEAKNGEEALALAEGEQPELVITDIRMPKMDGLELMKRLGETKAKFTVIVLSGYDEFSYAKEAIRCGVFSYILKPVDRNELIATVTDAIARIERGKKRDTEKRVRKIMSEGRLSTTTDSGDFSFGAPFRFVIVTGSFDPEFIPVLEGRDCCVIEKKNGSLSILVHEEEKKILEQYVLAEDLYLGSSGVCTSLSSLRVAWRQATLASFERFFRKDARVFECDQTPRPMDRSQMDTTFDKVSALIGSGDVPSLSAAVDALFSFDDILLADRAQYFYLLRDFVENGIIRKYWEYTDADMYLTLKALMIENIDLVPTLDDYRQSVRDFVIYLDSIQKKARAEYPFVTQALEFIHGHFTDDINMTVVANHVSVNYTWFSEKFKEQTGINFNDYLKSLRIAEAKRLLEKGCYKVYEVANNSGFGDVKYFTRAFKEITGLSPGEYRKKF